MDCKGTKLYKTTSDYNSPTDCYDACVSCLAVAIDAGATQAMCTDSKGVAICSMGIGDFPLR